jgi:rare lipoprotein A (peptidoglycan hydrolase)
MAQARPEAGMTTLILSAWLLTSTPIAPPTDTAVTGMASWYSDGPGLYAAVPSWHYGDTPYRIRVSGNGRSVVVTVRDFCGCPGNRVVDLSPAAFSRLAPLSAGLVRVTIERMADPGPTMPATDS